MTSNRSRRRARLSRARDLMMALLVLSACESDTEKTGYEVETQSSTVACVPMGEAPPPAAWVCPEPRTLACGEALPPLYLRETEALRCTDALTVAVPARLAPGRHVLRVTEGDGGVACEAPVTVVDTTAPVLTPRTVSLWPPNHKLHTIDVAQCADVVDACEPGLRAEFTWVSSDEPVDGVGAGKRDADVVLDGCGRVQLRAERQGGEDGRVYKLGVRAMDGAGNAAESVCTVVVAHDQSGATAIDSGERYRIALNGLGGTPACGGAQESGSSVP